MYSMFIVDDNPLDRNGVQSLLDWGSIGIKVTGTFRNGKMAMDHVQELAPDLILTDIQMPVMNGLELAAKVKELRPETKIIFMSSYDEFDYARLALRLEVEDYVLKPILKDELASTVAKAVSRLESEARMAREREGMLRQLTQSLALYQEQFLRDLLFGQYTDTDEIKERMDMLDIRLSAMDLFQVMSMRICDYGSASKSLNVSDKYFVSYSIKKLARALQGVDLSVYTVQISDKDYVFVSAFLKGADREQHCLLDTMIGLKENIDESLGLYTLLGVSRLSDQWAAIPSLYEMSVDAVNTKYFSDSAQIVLYQDIEEMGRNAGAKIDFQKLYKRVKDMVTEADPVDLEPFCREFLDKRAQPMTEPYIQSLVVSVQNTVQLLYLENGKTYDVPNVSEPGSEAAAKHIDSLESLKVWLLGVVGSLKDRLYAGFKPQYEQIVTDIKTIIADKYREPITVQDIANAIYISPGHANHIFKAKTGRTIFDYLIDYRIETAKTLLRSPSSRVYLVAQEVGYTNKSHFCLLFKKVTGLTPMEYKNGAGAG